MKRFVPAVLAIPALALSASAAAKDVDASKLDKPQVYKELVECRKIADATQRLACYDSKVAALEQATDSHDLVIADKAEVNEARRGLFGFRLPTLKLFGGGSGSQGKAAEDDEIKEIDTTLKSARQMRYGSWLMVLEDGAVWQQTDTRMIVMDPHAGSKIRIKRGAFGSYMASIDGQPGVKVRRVE